MNRRRPSFVLAFSCGAGIVFGAFVLALFLSGGPDLALAPARAASPTGGNSGSATTEHSVPQPAQAAIRVGVSDYGPILFDGHGRALYAFTSDPRGESVCTGDCAAAWPPYLARGRPRARGGAEQTLLGTARRPDGMLQVAYRGRPLYYFVGDREPGQVLCQGVVEFGGTWLVVRGSGRLVK